MGRARANSTGSHTQLRENVIAPSNVGKITSNQAFFIEFKNNKCCNLHDLVYGAQWIQVAIGQIFFQNN